MKNSGVLFGLFLFTLLFFQGQAWADSDTQLSEKDQSTANYDKAKKLLPGEEVVTPAGQKLRVWTTEGPVPVSKAPQPFQDDQGRVLKNSSILVDERGNRNSFQPSKADSFEIK